MEQINYFEKVICIECGTLIIDERPISLECTDRHMAFIDSFGGDESKMEVSVDKTRFVRFDLCARCYIEELSSK